MKSLATDLTSATITSNYIGSLTSDNPTYVRPDNPFGKFYYVALEIPITTPDAYTFRISSSTKIAGYLYNGQFFPRIPSANPYVQIKEIGATNLLSADIDLTAGRTYTLVITTQTAFDTGSFTIDVSGPISVKFVPVTDVITSKLRS